MAFKPIAPPPQDERPMWEPYGLPGKLSNLERHRETGATRVNPEALAAMLAEWEEHTE